jgi:hypothetical protein
MLALPAGEEPLPIPRPVTIELSNGSKIDGTLIERENSVTVLRVSGGEVRFADKNIRRIIEASPEADTPTGIQASPDQVKIELPAPGAMSFVIPDAWTETRIEGRDLGFTDPTQRLFLGISSAADQHSLWNLTPGIKKEYGKLYPGFTLGREKYLVKGTVKVWEIEYSYTKDSKDFREVQMILDFGETKRIFTFTTSAESFGELAHRFRGVVDSFRSDAFRSPAPPPADDGPPAPPASRIPENAKKSVSTAGRQDSAAAPEQELEIDLGPLLPIPVEQPPPCTDRGA